MLQRLLPLPSLLREMSDWMRCLAYATFCAGVIFLKSGEPSGFTGTPFAAGTAAAGLAITVEAGAEGILVRAPGRDAEPPEPPAPNVTFGFAGADVGAAAAGFATVVEPPA